MQIEVFLNKEKVQVDIHPDMMLLDFLRSMNLKSMKRGCDTGNCGLCTVWVDGKPVLSCGVPAARVQGAHITTLEGVQKVAATLHIPPDVSRPGGKADAPPLGELLPRRFFRLPSRFL